MNKGRQIAYIAIVVILALVVAGANLLQWNSLSTLQRNLADEKYRLEQARTRLLLLESLKENKEKLEADYEVLSALLPYGGAEDRLIFDMQSGADLSGMRFVNIRLDDHLQGEGFWEIPVTMVFEGNYHQLLNFMDYLQVYERALRLDEMRIVQNEDLERPLIIDVRASVFFAEDKNE